MDALDLVSLNEFKDFKPKQLSGGLLRRLNIACGIAHKPSLIFLDEPTVAVDPQSRNNILEGIKKLNSTGATVVYTTHYMEEVEQLCNRIIIIDKGKIIAEGTKEDLKLLVDIEEKVTVEASNISEEFITELNKLKVVDEVSYDGKILYVTYKNGKNNLNNLIDMLKENNRITSYNVCYTKLLRI